MATSKISVTEGSGKNLASYSFTEDAVTKEVQRIVLVGPDGQPIHQSQGTLTGEYMATTYRTVGAASANVNFFWIGNPTGSGKKVAVKLLTVQFDHTTLLATTSNIICSHFAGTPTGGTTAALTSKVDPSYVNASAATLQLATADGTNGTAISATPGSRVWSQWTTRGHTLAGWFLQEDQLMVPRTAIDSPIILAENDGLLLTYVQALTTGAFILVNCFWREYTV